MINNNGGKVCVIPKYINLLLVFIMEHSYESKSMCECVEKCVEEWMDIWLTDVLNSN